MEERNSTAHVTGFIGLGAMGSAIARRLVASGVPLHVYDPDAARVKSLVERGAIAHDSPRSVADTAQIVYACLPDAEVSRAVAYGQDGICGGRAIRGYIEMSTIGRSTVMDIAQQLKAYGVTVLDAPVSGGPKGADAGTLSIMVAGDPSFCDSIQYQLNAIAANVFRIGDTPGLGQMMKLVNNLISAANMTSAYEALVLGAKAGLDGETMVSVINASTGRNSATTDKIPKAVLPRTFDYGATIRTIHKDVALGLAEAEQLGVPMWVGRNTHQMWEYAITQGGADLDFTALILYLERWANVEVRSRIAVNNDKKESI
ncbi:MAG TPA: NAD(P)-dependent oxidoreductase [Advenella sp.]|nr:NAD(P)-dependent oxidoreductase [Advenella sp.]